MPFCISFLGRHGTDKVAVVRIDQAEARLQEADRIDWVPMTASPRLSHSPEPSFPETRVNKEVNSKASPERSRSTKASTGETLDRSRSRSKSAGKKPKISKVNTNSYTAQLGALHVELSRVDSCILSVEFQVCISRLMNNLVQGSRSRLWLNSWSRVKCMWLVLMNNLVQKLKE